MLSSEANASPFSQEGNFPTGTLRSLFAGEEATARARSKRRMIAAVSSVPDRISVLHG
jgi:hypothetical protein